MANADKPHGAKWIRSISGQNPIINKYVTPAADGTALFVGDFVTIDDSVGADANGMPSVIQASAGGPLTGVVMGFEPVPTNLETMHRLASTARVVLVCDDPYAVYQIQDDGVTDAGAVLQAEIGENTEIVASVTGSSTSGLSGMELDGDVTGTATAQLRILRLAQIPGNEIGAWAEYEVMINEHDIKSTTAGVA